MPLVRENRTASALRSVLLLGLAAFAAAPSASAQLMEAVRVGAAAGRPTAIEFAPGVDDQAYVATKQGRIWVFRNGTYLSTPFLAIQSIVQDAGEGGMVGFTFDPDFQNNGAFYVAYGLEGTTFGDVV
ncbi:MAG: PQQ-dependent sugar dehydrogenase [Planctomycetota bacterium]